MQDDLSSRFHPRTDLNFNLLDAMVCFQRVASGTVHKLRTYDLHVVLHLKPDVIIELGTNDLAYLSPEVVGSEIKELVSLPLETFSICVIHVCQVFPQVRPIRSANLLTEAVSLCQKFFGDLILPSPTLLNLSIWLMVFI